MLQFDVEKAKKVFNYDEEQYNEEYFLNTLKNYLDYFMYHDKNLNINQYYLIRNCWVLINCINLVDEKEV